MMGQGGIRAFGAQLFLEEQRRIFDYWLALKGDADMPPRAALSPAGIPDLLPHVSLIELLPDPDVIRVRLAGTGLWDIHGREITGRTLANHDWGGNRDYWKRNYDLIRQQPRPVAGMLRAPAAGKDHLVQFWLRLPMSNGEDGGVILLGLDLCVAASKLGAEHADGNEAVSLTAS